MSLRKFFHLPVVASSHGHEIDLQIYLVHFLMFALFIGWGIYFFVALWKFRRKKHPKADYVGTTSHFSTIVEVGVVLFEAILLLGLSVPFWAKQINAMPNRKDVVEVRVVAEQFAWNVHYPGPDGRFGSSSPKYVDKQSNPLGLDPNDPNGKDDFTTINQLHLPVGKPAIIHLTSRDVIHSFFLPVMRVKQDVVPGMSIPTWFTPTKTGHWEIACAQLCGLGHYRMKGFLTIQSEKDFKAWSDSQVAAAQSSGDDSDSFWN